jgi:hypothetical protein
MDETQQFFEKFSTCETVSTSLETEIRRILRAAKEKVFATEEEVCVFLNTDVLTDLEFRNVGPFLKVQHVLLLTAGYKNYDNISKPFIVTLQLNGR